MATNLTLKQIQDILAAGAGGYTGQDGSIYNFSNNSMTDYTGGIDAPTIAGPNYFHASHDGVYDSFDNEGKYVGTDKQGNAANDMGKFLLAAGALAGGASAFGGAAGGGAAAGGVGAGQFGGLAALDTAAAASAAGGLSAADAALIASLGDGTFAAGAGGIGGAGAAAGGGAAAGVASPFDPISMSVPGVAPVTAADFSALLGGDAALGTAGAAVSPFTMSGGGGGGLIDSLKSLTGDITGSDVLKYGGALAGAISGFQGAPGGTTTTQKTLDPKLQNAYFGADGTGGLLGSATAWFDKYKDTGMNDAMSSANKWQRGILEDPGLRAGLFSQGGNGVSLMNQPRTTNPFLNPSFNGKWGG